MIYFRSDYSQGAHPKVMQALAETNLEHTDGYAMDPHSEHAAQMVKDLIGVQDCDVYMMVGGTPCNVTVISAGLKPYEVVVAPRSGHIYRHESGAIEAEGHRAILSERRIGSSKPIVGGGIVYTDKKRSPITTDF